MFHFVFESETSGPQVNFEWNGNGWMIIVFSWVWLCLVCLSSVSDSCRGFHFSFYSLFRFSLVSLSLEFYKSKAEIKKEKGGRGEKCHTAEHSRLSVLSVERSLRSLFLFRSPSLFIFLKSQFRSHDLITTSLIILVVAPALVYCQFYLSAGWVSIFQP